MDKILFLSSNPNGTNHLALEKELKTIRETLQLSDNRDKFYLESRGDLTFEDLQSYLLQIKPRILHFSGHGSGETGIILSNDQDEAVQVSTDALADLFSLFNNQFPERLECVFLNACYTKFQADEIVKHIKYVIGTNKKIEDQLAIDFSQGFYKGLGAGISIEAAYQLAVNALEGQLSQLNPTPTGSPLNSEESLIPLLRKRADLGIESAYLDPQEYTGRIWTWIRPEPENSGKKHLIIINWGRYQWQDIKDLPWGGLLLVYYKRNQDSITRFVSVKPVKNIYDYDGVEKITEKTTIVNSYLNVLPPHGRQEIIEDSWIQRN
ncbi:MAG: CHAT domain-containing protein [Limnoraphis sp. WC205]|jgi:hypothetical protein|nr:CHAT domain-containing protein [Limnoraphis sp. WC205]